MLMKKRIDQQCPFCQTIFKTYITSKGNPSRRFCSHKCSQHSNLERSRAQRKEKAKWRIQIPEGTFCACGCGKPLTTKSTWDYRNNRMRKFLPYHFAKKQKVIKQCLKCGKEFEISYAQRARKFCSHICASAFNGDARIGTSRTIEVPHQCPICGKEYSVNKSALEYGRNATCSVECGHQLAGLMKRVPIDKAVSPQTHRRNYTKAFPRTLCNKCGYSKVPEILQLHHKDENCSNGAFYNLEWICPNCHMEEHYLRRTGPFKLHIKKHHSSHHDFEPSHSRDVSNCTD